MNSDPTAEDWFSPFQWLQTATVLGVGGLVEYTTDVPWQSHIIVATVALGIAYVSYHWNIGRWANTGGETA